MILPPILLMSRVDTTEVWILLKATKSQRLRDLVSVWAKSNFRMWRNLWSTSVKSKPMAFAWKSPHQKCAAPLKLRKNSRMTLVRIYDLSAWFHSIHVLHNSFPEQIYLKTTVLEHEILSGSWKSEPFSPSLSSRWNHLDSTVTIPLVNEDGIEHVAVKTTVATKTKLGKKIVLGTIYIRPNLDTSLEQWTTMLTSRNTPVPMWYSFE